MTPRVIRANRGHSAWRQKLAPQPDSGSPGMRPMDHMARSTPRSRGGPNFPVAAPFRQNGGRQQRQWRDNLNVNQDSPMQLSPIQRAWLQRNLGVNSSRGLSRYIRQAGGVDPFEQMLAGMPGWGRASAGLGRGRGGPPQGQPGQGQGQGGQGPGPIHGMVGGSVPFPGQPGGQGQFGSSQQPGQIQGHVGGTLPMGPQPGLQGKPPETPPVQPMFPDQAARYGVGQPQQPQANPAVSPQGDIAPQQTPRSGQAQRAVSPQGQNGAMTPQDIGQQLATEPVALATAMAYKGATNRDEQKKQDKERFAKYGFDLDPEVEEGMRALTDEYIKALIELGYSEADAAAYVNIQKERLAQNMGIEQGRTDEEAAEAGVLGGGVHQQMQQDLTTDYGRQFEDLALSAAQQERGFVDQRAALLEALRNGRIDLSFLGAANAFEMGATTPFSGMRTGGRQRPRSRRRSERERRG